jgi:hypothetical protein
MLLKIGFYVAITAYLAVAVGLFYLRSDYIVYVALPWSFLIMMLSGMIHSTDGFQGTLIFSIFLAGAVINSLIFLIIFRPHKKSDA